MARPPGPGALEILADLGAYLRDPLSRWARWHREYGDLVSWDLPGIAATLVLHPEHVEEVLVRRQRNYPREGPGYDLLKTVQGQGLATASGEHWRRQRRLAQPVFHQRHVDAFAPVMTRLAGELAERWARERPAALDLGEEMMRLAIRIGAETLASADLRPHLETIERALLVILDELGTRITRPLSWPLQLPLPRHRRYRRAIAAIDEVVYPAIRARRAQADPPRDLLALLMSARDEETGEGMSDLQLRDEIVTLAGAGHETTSLAFTWTLYLLSVHPEARRRLEEELDRVVPEGPLEPRHLEDLPWLRAVVAESLRLHPPVHALMRRAREADSLGDRDLPAGSYVVVSPWVTHRHPDFWRDPAAFDPERFLGEDLPGGHRLAYLPFGAGPHLCIGQPFALLDLHLVIGTLVRRVRLDLLPGGTVRPLPRLTLRPSGPVVMRATPRAC